MNKGIAFLLLVAAIAAPSAGLSHSHKKRSLEVVHPWTMATLEQDPSTARVYMTIKNSGRTPDRLVSASMPRAGKVELSLGDGAAKDNKSDAAFTIAPGKVLALYPNGPHLVLTGVKRAFHAYDYVKMTLVFEKAGRMAVDVFVEESPEGLQH
jgi:copper(I)-binding protein